MDDNKILLGTRIRKIREGKSLTQEKLAELMDINAKYLSGIERGKENPTLDMLIRLAIALDVEMWELFNFKHEMSVEELKAYMSQFIEESKENDLRTAVKIFRSVTR